MVAESWRGAGAGRAIHRGAGPMRAHLRPRAVFLRPARLRRSPDQCTPGRWSRRSPVPYRRSARLHRGGHEVLGIMINPQNDEQISRRVNGFKHELLHPTLPAGTTTSSPPAEVRAAAAAGVLRRSRLRRAARDPQASRSGPWRSSSTRLLAVFSRRWRSSRSAERRCWRAAAARLPVFPVVYLLAALVARSGRADRWSPLAPSRPLLDRLRGAAPWIVVGALFVLVNVDIFGYPTRVRGVLRRRPAGVPARPA